ncbi:MAG TPA: response regulator [Steroidobacteraceae bacterium]|nr:response regulator [Steroidobacteraceae bacterium]
MVAIIEADARARDALRSLIATLDVDVSTFDTAEDYLHAHRRANCLIAQIALPGMSGIDLLRRLRSGGDTLPVILLADESDVPTAVAAMREGASDFIEKPHADVAILRRVSQLLRRPHRSRERAGHRA